MNDFKTNISILTNLCPTHLDYHGSYKSYRNVKLKIFNHIYENYIKYFEPNFSFLKTTGYLRCYKAWLAPYKHIIFKNYIKKIPDLPT